MRKLLIGGVQAAVLLAGCIGWTASTSAADEAPPRPLRLLVDEYHQQPEPDTFSQGFSLNRDERELTYHYATDASGIVNGLFVLTQVIADDYDVRISRDPIDASLAERADAFMILCPPSPEKGGPHPLTEQDADHLEAFVAGGGILILAYNSVASPEQDSLDYAGMNRIAERFGMTIEPTTTRSLSVPIPRDHPVLFGVRGMIYGNGCTITTRDQPDTHHAVLLESTNPDVPGAIAVRARYHRGTVLLIGDAGVLGNAHMAREDVGQIAAVRQMFHSLLPDGPLPGYGWRDGLRLRVKLWHELGITGAPEGLRLLDLPLHEDAKSTLVGVRDLDLQSAPGALRDATPEQAERLLPKRRYALARANWEAQTELVLGPVESNGFTRGATWRGPGDARLAARLTPRGEVVELAADSGALTDWRWALAGAVIAAPIDPAAQVGDTWTAPASAAVPMAQLHPAPLRREVEATFRLDRREAFRGRDCLVVTRTIVTPLNDLRPQELVDPAFADYFDEQKVRLRNAHHTERLTAWIDAATRLPVHSELQASTTYWWTNREEEDWYLSDHDHRVFETSHQTLHLTILGRLLRADFEVVGE